MASVSIRDLTSYIAVVAYSHVTPRSDKWPEYKQESQGAKEFLGVIEKVTVTRSKPMNLEFLLNEDCSS